MEEESTRQSRLFVILAIALIGLLVLGLLGIGGVFVIRQNLQEQTVRSRTTPTLVVNLPQPTATFTPIKPAATNTPAPTPTNTPVVAPGGSNSTGEQVSIGGDEPGENENTLQIPQSTPILRPTPRTPAESPSAVPSTGLGALEAILITVGLIGVLFAARRLRMSL